MSRPMMQHSVCSYCSALYFSCEKNSAGYFGLCCCNKLPEFQIPDEIKDLYTGDNEMSSLDAAFSEIFIWAKFRERNFYAKSGKPNLTKDININITLYSRYYKELLE